MVGLDDTGSNPDADTVAIGNVGGVSAQRGGITEEVEIICVNIK